ncbi:hypothetical protein PTNB85_03654 [Pyrenophora teres f. teres]|uniref:Uncharacterized protein n=1 Tax=Pyrenophora teres f. teres TaxID=97479 RepID=A0A6S6W3T3_9PLEO|nr:hypothetical protein HRS9139_03807 [Pyrenophora teres f. teres]KAE8845389.1 hypothetical protein PTNB85_03654 [Pyrenophora teres f. teres]KAE8865463.1 hypothetical protein PTNB29_02610 [Pyrenophora teres f. teres]CAE7173883.1 hypothetical protein PTTW11_05523 [Pyrenophora teres f. teres]
MEYRNPPIYSGYPPSGRNNQPTRPPTYHGSQQARPWDAHYHHPGHDRRCYGPSGGDRHEYSPSGYDGSGNGDPQPSRQRLVDDRLAELYAELARNKEMIRSKTALLQSRQRIAETNRPLVKYTTDYDAENPPPLTEPSVADADANPDNVPNPEITTRAPPIVNPLLRQAAASTNMQGSSNPSLTKKKRFEMMQKTLDNLLNMEFDPDSPRQRTFGFGDGWSEDCVHPWKYGADMHDHLGLCNSMFLHGGCKKEDCDLVHSWPSEKQVIYLLSNPNPKYAKHTRNFLQEHLIGWFYAWKDSGFCEFDDPVPAKPGRRANYDPPHKRTPVPQDHQSRQRSEASRAEHKGNRYVTSYQANLPNWRCSPDASS